MGIVKGKKSEFKLKEHLAKLKKDMEPMTFKEKVDHIWTYYKYHMLVAFCVLFLVGGTMYSFFLPREKVLLAGVQCNMQMSNEGYDYLTKGYRAQYLKNAEGNTNLYTFRFHGEGTVEAVEHTTQAYYSVTSYVEAQKLDYMLMDMYTVTYFGSDRLFMDLREILSEEELARLDEQGLILYEESEEDGKTTPRAINISSMPFCTEQIKAEKCYLAFVRNTPRKEACKQLWEHIKNYQ